MGVAVMVAKQESVAAIVVVTDVVVTQLTAALSRKIISCYSSKCPHIGKYFQINFKFFLNTLHKEILNLLFHRIYNDTSPLFD